MKYDEDGEDKTDSARHNKDEGNKHFKFKKYRWAIDCYTNGWFFISLSRRQRNKS